MTFHATFGSSWATWWQRGRKEPAVNGFSLVEMLIATLILSFGLLGAARIIYSAVCSASLARSKGSIALAAQDKLEFLADLYARDPGAAELTTGEHGPDLVAVVNPLTGAVLNRFSVSWQVRAVADPRPGKSLVARQVVISVKPVNAEGGTNYTPLLNKSVVVARVLSPRD